MILMLLPGLVLMATVAWRFWPGPAGFVASGLVLLWTLRIALMRVPAAWLLFACATLGAAVSLAGRLEFLWPCEMTCAGGEAWQMWRGVPLTLGAFASLSVLAVTSLWDARRRRLGLLTQGIAWLHVGASAYFIGLAIQLGMVCGHCLSVHTAVLSFLAVLGVFGRRSLVGLVLAVVAAVTIHVGYAPVRGSLLPEDPGLTEGPDGGTEAPTVSAEHKALRARADQGRRMGPDEAPFRVEIVQAFTCGHCAKAHVPTVTTLQELCDKGQLQVVWRHQVPWNLEEGIEILQLSLVAASEGDYEAFTRDAFRAQGDPAGAENWRDGPTARVLRALGKRRDLTVLEATRQEHLAVLQSLAVEEKRRVRELGGEGELPYAYLTDTASGEIVKSWVGGEFEAYDVRQFVLVELSKREELSKR